MPFCQIPNDVPLHYITNTTRGDASDLDPDKPVILLLPHNLTDVTWLREQLRHPLLSTRYNLVAIDLRNMGRSKAPFEVRHDTWVDAADVALVHEVLQLPPCHLFASGTRSCATAMCLAMLFPERFLSLFLCSPPMQMADTPEWVLQDEQELLELWCFPRDLETFHIACIISISYFISNDAAIELQNELVGWWQKECCPKNRSSVVYCTLPSVIRPLYSTKELQAIQAPTFIVQGDKGRAKSLEYARSLSANIPNARFLPVKGGPDCMIIVPAYASLVNREFGEFLQSLPPPPARSVSPPDPEGIFKTGLERLAALADDSEIAQRDPTTTLSFSRASSEDISIATKLFQRCSRGEEDVINTLDERGEPKMRFSKKFKDKGDGFGKARLPPMAAEAEIVMVESCTVLETEK